MLINSKFTKSFISDRISNSKYKELHDYAIVLNDHKNLVSNDVCSNLGFYMNLSTFDFIKHFRAKHYGVISSNFDKHLYHDIFTCYENKFKAIQNKIGFENIRFIGFEYYSRKTKDKQKGDFKGVINKKYSSKLSITLTYLSRYGNENTVDYINKQLLLDIPDDKKDYYKSLLFYINKFGFDRLYRLSLQRRNRIIAKYSSKVIEFKSLTFRGRSRLAKRDIISYNFNRKSDIKSFINISWLGRGNSLSIPVKYSKEYHGLMTEYHKDTPDIEYSIIFTDNGKIKINICKSGERYIPENKTNYVGIDVNVKHNLFSLSTNKTFDYNRKLLNDISVKLSDIDKLKENKDYKVGKKKQRSLNSIRNKIIKFNESVCYDVCKYLNSEGLDHIVMEDLDNSFGSTNVKDVNNSGINFNRITKELRLSSLKGMMEHIGRKYGISVSTIHSSYTSKMCCSCGCIDDGNRKNQEEFECVECGYVSNADYNASINIKNRVSSTVLRSKLLKLNKLDNGSYEPKSMKREKVKEVLLSFRQNLAIDRDILDYTYK